MMICILNFAEQLGQAKTLFGFDLSKLGFMVWVSDYFLLFVIGMCFGVN